MKQCLFCYQPLRGNEIDFHPSCSRKIFDQPIPPELPYKEAQMAELAVQVRAADGHAPFTVDLEACEIRGPGGYECRFDIAPFERAALLEGLDDIGQTLQHASEIDGFEATRRQSQPWMPSTAA